MNIAAIALVLLAQTASADSVRLTVTARLDKDAARIGERLTLTVSVDGVSENEAVIFPELPDTGWVTAVGPPLISADREGSTRSARYELTAWDIGARPLPLAEIRVMSESAEQVIALPEVIVSVISVLPPDSANGSLAWKPPADVVGPNWSVGEKSAAAGLILALLFGMLTYLRRRAADRPVPVPAPRPPRERALDALDVLEASGLPEAGELKGFYSILSDIVRGFLAESVPDWRRDLTTRELIEAVDLNEIRESEREALRALLDDADVVKFARLRPSLAEAYVSIVAARHWITSFEPPEKKPEVPVELEVGAAVSVAELESLVDLDSMFADEETDDVSSRGSELT